MIHYDDFFLGFVLGFITSSVLTIGLAILWG